MSKNKILEERTRTYFIQAAMGILRSEGLSCVSARNVAEQAGYSYATLYNYFKDMKDLVLVCMEEFRRECLDYVLQETADRTAESLIPRVQRKFRALIKYFVQYPGIYDLFYLEKMPAAGDRRGRAGMTVRLIRDILGEDWEACCAGKKSDRECSFLRDQLLFTTSGLLLLFMNRGYPSDYGELTRTMDQQLERLLG